MDGLVYSTVRLALGTSAAVELASPTSRCLRMLAASLFELGGLSVPQEVCAGNALECRRTWCVYGVLWLQHWQFVCQHAADIASMASHDKLSGTITPDHIG